MTADNSSMLSVFALGISALALTISAITAWVTLFKRGTVKMTHPTVIFFGPDGGEAREPKVFLRTLLFSTSKRGRIIESMYVTLSCDDIDQTFDVWAYGERNELVRGSGLFVGETGVEANHHFLISRDSESFTFFAGEYQLNIYANLLGEQKQKLLFAKQFSISPEDANVIGEHGSGLYFDWSPEDRQYVSHIHKGPRSFWEAKRPT